MQYAARGEGAILEECIDLIEICHVRTSVTRLALVASMRTGLGSQPLMGGDLHHAR